jgi:hypothetical protein
VYLDFHTAYFIASQTIEKRAVDCRIARELSEALRVESFQ